MPENTRKYWALNGEYFSLCDSSAEKLEPGYYEPEWTNRGVALIKRGLKSDNLFEVPESVSADILASMGQFWSREDRFRECGLMFKRGILLHGPPGAGKTCAIELVCNRLIAEGALVIMGSRAVNLLQGALTMIRQAEPDRRLVVILEDIDRIIQNFDSELSSLLDGEKQIDNVIFLATTNYLNTLPATITKRPSRFDVLYEVGMPCDEARRRYLETKFDGAGSDEIIDEAVKATTGFSFAHLREMTIRMLVFDTPLDQARDEIGTMLAEPQAATNRGPIRCVEVAEANDADEITDAEFEEIARRGGLP